MKKDDLIQIVLMSLIGILLVTICIVLIFKLSEKPEELKQNVETSTVTEPVSANTAPVVDVVEEQSTEEQNTEEVIDLSPNDSMIYAAMDSDVYRNLCKQLNANLRVGITDVSEVQNKGIVVTFILDNTDATFTSETINGITYFTPIENKYGSEYPIVYFPDGTPEYSFDLYSYLGNNYTGKVLIALSVTDTYYELSDVETGEVIKGYMN